MSFQSLECDGPPSLCYSDTVRADLRMPSADKEFLRGAAPVTKRRQAVALQSYRSFDQSRGLLIE